jgi:hypothetical protein
MFDFKIEIFAFYAGSEIRKPASTLKAQLLCAFLFD